MIEVSNRRSSWAVGILIAVNAIYFFSRDRSKSSAFKLGFLGFDVPDVVCFSPSKLAVPIEQLFFSTFVIFLICALSHFLRQAAKVYVSDALIKILLQEAIAAADLCGCCFELIIVADNFGVWMYGIYLFLLTLWWSKDWGEANACPNVQLEDVVLGKQDCQLSLTKIWAQLTGGIFIFKFIQFLWSLELIENHEKRAFEKCTGDLQVSMLQGILIEGGGTFLGQLISKIIADTEPKFGGIIQSFIETSMVVAAFDRTGGYFNPALATALKFGCEGNSLKEHVMVYWVGGCVGSVFSVFLYHHTPVKQFFKKFALKNAEKMEDYNNFWDNKSD